MKTFNPVKLSTAENKFLLDHLGEAPVKALREIKGVRNPNAHPKDKNPIIYPDGVVPAAVKPILEGIYELEMLAREDGVKWIGIEKVKDAIRVWLRENAKWASDAQRYKNAPRFPSLYTYDSKGRAHRQGPGSDSGEVKTYFGPAGERIPFEIELLMDYVPEWIAPAETEAAQVESQLKVNTDLSRIECHVPLSAGGVCGHTESYKASNRASYNAARARMSKHLRKTNEEVDAHRELHTNEFGS